ncbi:citrate/2-methylcitrate synthase [Nocardia sp. alder85J]|uniref:citrate/2-methylcitrate synthase n=1 Tax=Nocardia sp. alder85J TaxID=2862949 RepID=UPI001CD29609|nr:citrate/2-methylcitrate synthase [Nocardia sp. alder85J]MCX4096409.1 citrate/2-methylcitrate synthase [Nocardia sp. alder85J]
MAEQWLDSVAAAQRLGVRPATLYAYVSRGVLRRHYDPQRRRSLFDPADIERLARRGRPRRRPAPTEIVVESRITELGADRPYYRGLDALELADTARFEEVAEWLWTGDRRDTGPWTARPAGLTAARLAQRHLPGDTPAFDRLPIIVSTLAIGDPLRTGRDAAAVTELARSLIAGLVQALPPRSEPAGDSIAALLRSRLTPDPPGHGLDPALLDTALILLADHELAASTFAARVAASVSADPYAVVAAGLGVVGGAMHGGASLAAERLLAAADTPGAAVHLVADRLRRRDHIPGFGHAVYTVDARGTQLLDRIRALYPDHPKVAVAEAIRTELRIRRRPAANVDLGLALLGAVHDLPPGSGETVFAVARTAGWLAHALEEYTTGTRIRPRAITSGGQRRDA